MGLDMYLNARRYVFGYKHNLPAEHAQYTSLVSLFGIADYVDPETPQAHVLFTVAYWRKANAIHNWFVANVQDGKDDCQTSTVDREQLAALRAVCQEVLDSSPTERGEVHVGTQWDALGQHEMYEPGEVVVNTSVAERLLPTTSGFFFGGTDYNQFYLAHLRHTITQIDRALAMPEDWYFEYHASW
jgi:hypothetical protein